MSDGRRWADDATLLPSGERLKQAAWDALTDPFTWAPLAGAAILQIDDWDERISDWAIDETPVFGSVQDAKDARGWTGNLADGIYFASVLATPSGDDPLGWGLDKAKGLGVGLAARVTTLGVTDLLKEVTGRERPLGDDDSSFPSQHVSTMTVDATLSSRNFHATTWPSAAKYAIDGGLVGVTAIGAWSRIEAGGHYPSDVLVGAALGNFIGRFFDEAFLRRPDNMRVEPVFSGGLYGLKVSFSF